MVQVLQGPLGGKIMAWVDGVQFEEQARQQLYNTASLSFIHDHVAAMPDVHLGYGSTVGSVIPTKGAVIPAAVGVDIGCGMMAWRTSLKATDLPDNLFAIRSAIEQAVPHGGLGPSSGWGNKVMPNSVMSRWHNSGLEARFKIICEKHPRIEHTNNLIHLGSLGGGNHFIEITLDETDRVWVMLHSGSRGVGNFIGTYFIEKARELLTHRGVHVPDRDLAWFEEGEPDFNDYVQAVAWGQDFARQNREQMMHTVMRVLRESGLPSFTTDKSAVNCHHNYVEKEHHFGADVWLTRKGAVSAKVGELGIIPGSMGARSYIVEGLGNPDSFCSCSHGAGRRMSRGEAKRSFTVEDHAEQTAGIECRKDIGVVDEIPAAYKDIDLVMAAQADLVRPVHTLRQVICVKG